MTDEIDKLREGLNKDIQWCMKSGTFADGSLNTNQYHSLMKQVDRLVAAECQRARMDEVNRIPYWGTPYDTDVFGYEKLFRDNRIAAISVPAEEEK